MRNGVSFTTRERCQDNRAYTDLDACGASARAADARRNAAGEQRLSGGASPDEEGTASQADAAAFGFWTGGTLRSGNFDGRAGSNSLDFETEGVSAGADRRFRPDFVAGLGLGYGQDSTAIGNNGTQLDGKAWTLAMYGSYHPGERLFVDGLLGYQRLSYDLERFVTANDGRVRGSRDGDQWFASLSIGTDLTRGGAQLTPYARVDAMRATLDPYTERGDAIYALTYGEQDVDTTTGNIGLRMAFRRNATWGAFSPQARLEYQHDFTADSRTFMQYADLLGPTYATSVSGYDRSRFMLGLGVLFDFGAYSLQVDYRGVVGSSDQRDNALQVMFQAGR
jgi:outer membrane autotransporter protein